VEWQERTFVARHASVVVDTAITMLRDVDADSEARFFLGLRAPETEADFA